MRRCGKSDLNQEEIVMALRKLGATVIVLSSIGKGCPDLLVGYRNQWHAMEVKAKSGRLTPDQVNFHLACRAPVHVVHSVSEAFDVVNGVIRIGHQVE